MCCSSTKMDFLSYLDRINKNLYDQYLELINNVRPTFYSTNNELMFNFRHTQIVVLTICNSLSCIILHIMINSSRSGIINFILKVMNRYLSGLVLKKNESYASVFRFAIVLLQQLLLTLDPAWYEFFLSVSILVNGTRFLKFRSLYSM